MYYSNTQTCKFFLTYILHNQAFSQFVSGFFSSKFHTVCTSRCAVTSDDVNNQSSLNRTICLQLQICSIKLYTPSLFGTQNVKTIFNLRFQHYLVLSPINRNVIFNIIWFVIFTVRRDLIFADQILNIINSKIVLMFYYRKITKSITYIIDVYAIYEQLALTS